MPSRLFIFPLTWRLGLQEEIHARPLFSSEKRELRVIQLEEGCPALYAIPTPNPENENSAIMLSYQVALILSFKELIK